MVVIRFGARAPLRPLTRTSDPQAAFRKFEFGKNNPRKNIFGVSKNDSEKNLKLATTLLQSSVVSFISKWNFDPVAETPLTAGKYSWVHIQPKTALPKPENKEIVEMNLNFKSSTTAETSGKRIDPNPSPDEINKFPSENSENEEGKSMILPSCTKSLSPLINNLNLYSTHPTPLCVDEKSVDTILTNSSAKPAAGLDDKFSNSVKSPNVKKFRQTKITDYGRIVKRKSRIAKYSITPPLDK